MQREDTLNSNTRRICRLRYHSAELKVWDLHTYPNDDWYDRAKKATDRCDLELTQQTQGAKNGLEDKVVWVSGLLDLKRGEAGNGEFTRSMDEYYRRFQTVLDNGARPKAGRMSRWRVDSAARQVDFRCVLSADTLLVRTRALQGFKWLSTSHPSSSRTCELTTRA